MRGHGRLAKHGGSIRRARRRYRLAVDHPNSPIVVLGSSLTGLLISRALSHAGAVHVLVGGEEPPHAPRLGESLNECSGPSLCRILGPDLAQFLHKKNHISLFNGSYASAAHIGNPREPLAFVREKVVRADRVAIPYGRTFLAHVDRVRLDPWVYRLARSDPACRFVSGRARSIDVREDRVTRIRLEDGRSIEAPRHVLDATGPGSPLAAAAGIATRSISPEQRVVWGHRGRTSAGGPKPWWEYGTNLIRTHQAIDGVDGIAWIIPIGDTLSVGLSVGADDARAADLPAEQLLDLLATAAARRGWDYRLRFPDGGAPIDLRHGYTVRERLHGANWFLAAGSFVQPWFPSSAGLWTATLAADIAPALAGGDGAVGGRYAQSMEQLLHVHAHIAQLIHGPAFRSLREAQGFWARWLAFVPRRLSDGLRVMNDDWKEHRSRHSLLRRGARVFGRFPRLQLALWGNAQVRCRYRPQLDEQSDAIASGYFNTTAYRIENYLRALPSLAWPLGTGLPPRWTLDDVCASGEGVLVQGS